MLHRRQHSRKNVLHHLHRGTASSSQNVYRSVDVSIVVRTTFRACPLPIRKGKIFVFVSAIATRFRCSRPPSNLTELTLMFETLELQNLNKLVEGKVRHLASPKAFHRIKVQCLSRDKVKPSAEVKIYAKTVCNCW